MAPMAAQLTLMMVRERPMEGMVEQLPGVMALAPLIAPMAARRVGVMVPDRPKVRVEVQRVGIVVPAALQPQLAENPEVGAGKRFMFYGMRENLIDFSSFLVLTHSNLIRYSYAIKKFITIIRHWYGFFAACWLC
jgi:hypothetical protein